MTASGKLTAKIIVYIYGIRGIQDTQMSRGLDNTSRRAAGWRHTMRFLFRN